MEGKTFRVSHRRSVVESYKSVIVSFWHIFNIFSISYYCGVFLLFCVEEVKSFIVLDQELYGLIYFWVMECMLEDTVYIFPTLLILIILVCIKLFHPISLTTKLL